MKVGIIGYGVVGSVLGQYFRKTHNEIQIQIRDPEKDYNNSMDGCAAIFISVPVPTMKWSGRQDFRYLTDAIKNLPAETDCPIFIRSTVLPGTCDDLAKTNDLKVYAMPEFLTERVATDDFERQNVLVGGREDMSYETMQLLKTLFPSKQIHFVRNREAEIIKYTHNAFAAVKVNFFNTVYQLCESKKADYSLVRKYVCEMTPFFTKTHTQVPGPDGELGFGGKCLPKDLYALTELLDKLGLPYQSLRATHEENLAYRGDV